MIAQKKIKKIKRVLSLLNTVLKDLHEILA